MNKTLSAFNELILATSQQSCDLLKTVFYSFQRIVGSRRDLHNRNFILFVDDDNVRESAAHVNAKRIHVVLLLAGC